MSFTITTDIFCDAPGCGEWMRGTVTNDAEKVKTAKLAMNKNWKVHGRLALCDDCIAKGFKIGMKTHQGHVRMAIEGPSR